MHPGCMPARLLAWISWESSTTTKINNPIDINIDNFLRVRATVTSRIPIAFAFAQQHPLETLLRAYNQA